MVNRVRRPPGRDRVPSPMAILLIHGGSGTIRNDVRSAYQAGLERALERGRTWLLGAGGSAYEAVRAAVVSMEDDPEAFNAGTGGSPTSAGTVECDAALMLSDGTSGAVACLQAARNPILIADRVRRETPYALIVGAGADALVDAPIANEALLTERSRAALARWRARGGAGPTGSATVGAVALDDWGRLAAATSTGGMLGKLPGRVGDSPIIGAGTYADERVAVSCTGDGEAFARAVSAKALADRLAAGEEVDAAIRATLEEVGTRGGRGGLICLTAEGRLGLGWSAAHMAYGYLTKEESLATVGLAAGTVVVI